MKKYRIGIFLNATPSYGGLFQYSLSVLDAMGSFTKEEIDIVAVYLDSIWESYLCQYNIKAYCLRETSTKKIYAAIHALACDLMVYPSQLSDIYLSEIVSDIPFVAMICDMNFYYDKEVFNESSGITDLSYLYMLRRMGNICNNAKGIFVDSYYGKKQIIQLYGEACESKIYVLPFTVPRYIVSGERKHVPPKGLPPKYIIYPANFLKYKNHTNLILAAARLRIKGIFIYLVLCGNKKRYYANICKTIEKEHMEEQVMLLPYVKNDDLVFLYRNARAMMMPTLVGPTNLPPLEAMFLGCPVAVSNVGAMPEQVGEGGMIFDPYDVADIARCMEVLWCDDNVCSDLIQRGYCQIEKYSLKAFQQNLLTGLRSCLMYMERYTNSLSQLLLKISGSKFVVCYGAGEYGYWIYEYLKSKNIKIMAFMDIYSNEKQLYEVPVIRPHEFTRNKNETIIILSIHENNHKEIIDNLFFLGYRNFYPITEKIIQEIFFICNKFPFELH